VLGWIRRSEDDECTVLVNFTAAAVELPDVGGVIEVASDGRGEGDPFTGSLGPDQAVVLRPGG
jgi:alpha-glucosidase